MILKENNSLKNEGEGEIRCGSSCAKLISSRVPPAENELRSGPGARSHRTAPLPCSGWDLSRTCVSHAPQQGFLPLAASYSPLEIYKLNQAQRLSGRCLEIRLGSSANQLWIQKVNITCLFLRLQQWVFKGSTFKSFHIYS